MRILRTLPHCPPRALCSSTGKYGFPCDGDWVCCVCVLTCPPEVRVVSNTKAYQSPLDVPPPPRNLTTRIKAKLRNTHCFRCLAPTRPPPQRKRVAVPRTDVSVKSMSHHSSLFNCIRDVQAHLLFPPPAAQYCPPLPHTLLTLGLLCKGGKESGER